MTLNEAGSDQARCRIICLGCALLVGLTLCACGSAQPYRATVSSYDLQRQDQEARYQRMLLVAQQDEQERYLALAEDGRSGKPQPWQGAMNYQNNSVYVPTGPTPANMSHAEAYRQRRDIAEKKARDLALSRREDQVREYERKAAEVMETGPFGEFGGPTRADVRFLAMLGCSEIPPSRRSRKAGPPVQVASRRSFAPPQAGSQSQDVQVVQASPKNLLLKPVANENEPIPNSPALNPSLQSMYIRDLSQIGAAHSVSQMSSIAMSNGPVFISGPNGAATAQTIGNTTYISGAGGRTTAQTIGNTTYISGPGGTATAQRIGNTTYITGAGGSTTAQTIGNTTYISGPNGRTTVQRTGSASGAATGQGKR